MYDDDRGVGFFHTGEFPETPSLSVGVLKITGIYPSVSQAVYVGGRLVDFGNSDVAALLTHLNVVFDVATLGFTTVSWRDEFRFDAPKMWIDVLGCAEVQLR